MNKFKPKINSPEFSPWEDSFQDVFATIHLAKQHPPRSQVPVLPTVPSLPKARRSLQRQRSKEGMNKTVLSISKINLHNTTAYYPEHPAASQRSPVQSMRYPGPRVTFYSKMNPRISGRSRSTLDPVSSDSQGKEAVRNQLTGRLIRDSSIKYLEIIQEKQDGGRQELGKVVARVMNLRGVGTRGQRPDEQHMYLRRLKMIYNTRRH